MNKNPNLDTFKNVYPVSKTLCFQLVPHPKTQEHIDKEDRIKLDTKVQDNCRVVKKIADRYHQEIIQSVLSGNRLKYLSDGNDDSIQEYAEAYYDRPAKGDRDAKDKRAKRLKKISSNLCKQVSGFFDEKEIKGEAFLDLVASAKFYKEVLPVMSLSSDERKALDSISSKTGYMKEYTAARSFIYNAKTEGNTIPNRIVKDNLPIHLRNSSLFDSLPEEIISAVETFGQASQWLYAESIRELFQVSAFSTLLDQTAIDSYNTVIGGIKLSDDKQLKGLNQIIAEYNARHKDDEPSETVKKRYDKFKKLKKQILSDRTTLSFVPVSMMKDDDVRDQIDAMRRTVSECLPKSSDMLRAAMKADTSKVFVSVKDLPRWSSFAFGAFGIAHDALIEVLKAKKPKSARKSEKKYEEEIEKLFKQAENYSLRDVSNAVSSFAPDVAQKTFVNYVREKFVDLYGQAETYEKKMVEELAKVSKEEKIGQERKGQKNEAVEAIHIWLDCILDAKRDALLFYQEESGEDVDPLVKEWITDPFAENNKDITTLYNSVRNYLMQKPYSTRKTRITYERPGLMSGWSTSKESVSKTMLLYRGDEKYVAIINGRANPFRKEKNDLESPWRKLDINFSSSMTKQLPKVAFAAGNASRFQPSEEVKAIYAKTRSKEKLSAEETTKLIAYYQSVIRLNHDWDKYGFRFGPAESYASVQEFIEDMGDERYEKSFIGIPEEAVEKAIDSGAIHLFRIYNQDMHPGHHGKTGTNNVILDEIFSEEPNRGLVRLCGESHIYYRKPSLKARVTHPKEQPIACKNPANKGKTRTLAYDLIKDKRYTEPRWMFHFAVKLNDFAPARGSSSMNAIAGKYIVEHPEMPVLAVNRGERNLIAYVLVAPDGTILKQGDFDVIDGYNYRDLLARREKERNDDRRAWNSIRDIKNIKEGYLSKVIGEIAHMVREYGCAVALESLDMEFRDSRRKFEKGVYTAFERALVNKLAFMADKDDPDRLANALQLCAPCKAGERMRGNMNGLVFFVQPWYISTTDPVTGFINRIDTRYKSIEKSVELLGSFDTIRYNKARDRFVFRFRYSDIDPKRFEGYDRLWNVVTEGDRVVFKKEGDVHENIQPTQKFKELLDGAGIGYADGEELKDKLAGQNAEFYKAFLKTLWATLGCRALGKGGDLRFVGCTTDKNGCVFDSATAGANQPVNNDTNAAWNIARKAWMVIDNIRSFNPKNPPLDPDGKKLERPRDTVSLVEWFDKNCG